VNSRPSTSSNRKSHTDQLRTRPPNDVQRRSSSTTNGRTFSMASSAMEDWDLPDTNQHTAAEQTENWDDDFEVETRNNSPRKPKLSTPQRREESWDDELELEAKLDSEFGRRDEEDRTVTARSRRAALSRFASANSSPPPPMPFFPTNIQHPSPEPFPRSPTASVFSVPNTIHTYSSSTGLVYGGSHPRPMSGFALLPPSPPIHKERERRRLRKKSRPRPEGTIELVGMASQYSFSDGEGPTKNGRSATPMSDVSSTDEYHRVLEPIPPLPTQPSVLATPSVPVTMASGSTTTTTPVTPTKTGATLFGRIGSVKKWGVRSRRGTSSTPSEVIGRFLFIFFLYFDLFSNLPF